MGFFSDIIEQGRTPDGREVTITRSSNGGYELHSSGSTTQYSSDLNYLKSQFNQQVPNDGAHRMSWF